MKIKVAKYISTFLVEKGITDCFMITGGGAMHLNDAIGHEKRIRCVFNHHEQACTMAAEGYARVTGKIAAVCVTSGPGGTNAITGVVGGWQDSIPMFILSGQAKRETIKWSCQELKLRQLGYQEFDIINSVQNMTKYAVMVTNPQEVAYHLEKAFYLAITGRPGPVWLDIPLDVQGAIIDTDTLIHFDSEIENPWPVPKVSEKQAEDILVKIKQAKAPLIVAGTGIRVGDAENEFLALVNKLQIPVVTAWGANDTLSFDNPYFAGMTGTIGIRPGNFAVQNCDLLITLGSRLNLFVIGYNHYEFAKNAYKIIVDIDRSELTKPTIRPDMAVHADVKDLMKKLLSLDYVAQDHHKKWLHWCKNLVYKYPVVLPEYYNQDAGLINPYVFIDKLFNATIPSDRIACGNGSACMVTLQAGKIKQGQRMFANSGCGAMGYGFPASIGVAVADNSRRTICIDGDGSIMMNLQELATVEYNHLNVKIFLINNNGYLSIRQTQRNLFKPPFVGLDSTSGVGFPNFKKIADAFSIAYYSIHTESECDAVTANVLNSDGPCICEVFVDPKQNFVPKSAAKVLPDGKIVSPAFEDMAPFLDRKEFESIKYK